jgi:uncharacterized protein YjiS (DUF1127 family)
MTMMENTFARASQSGFAASAAKVAHAMYYQAERAWRRRRDRRHIYEMPDYLLKDIGISRSEIDSVVMFGETDMTRRRRGAGH